MPTNITPSNREPNGDFRLPPLPVSNGQTVPEVAVAQFCVAAYFHMLDLQVRAIEELEGLLSSPGLGHQLAATELPLLADLRDQHRARLEFWWQLQAKSLDDGDPGRDGR